MWDDGCEVTSGRLELRQDRLELHGRTGSAVVPLTSIETATIARGYGYRLRGLPVLTLQLRSSAVIRIATLEGAGVLQEIAAHIQSSDDPPA